jgi:nucleoside-diphosphate-sugar epimerase
MAEHKAPCETVVAVTGASGYISSHIIKFLLEKGYHIIGIVRDLSSENKIAHLKKFPQKEGQLIFRQANIEDGTYGDVLKGANVLIHTATPYKYTADDPQKEIVDPAVKGTEDAIKAALAVGIKRVVITSSGGALFSLPITQEHTYTDKDWNNVSNLNNNPYFYSKKCAEEAAWKLYEQHKDKIEIVVVNPFFVLGPIQSPNINSSLSRLKSFLLSENNAQCMPGRVGVVDVRDVATAHVLAAEHPAAVGKRILVCSAVVSWKHIVDTIKKDFPHYPVVSSDGVNEGCNWGVDTSNLKALGFDHFISPDKTIKDSIDILIEQGIVENK